MASMDTTHKVSTPSYSDMDKGAQAAAKPVKGSFASLKSGLSAFMATARAIAPSGARLHVFLSPGIFPWATTVLDEEAQQRVAPELLGRGGDDERLVPISPEERSVAAAYAPNEINARDLTSTLDGEASRHSSTDPTTTAGEIPRRVRRPPLPPPRGVRPSPSLKSPAALSGSGFVSPRREAVEAALRQKDQTYATAVQAAARAAFPGVSRALLKAGRTGSSTGLPLGLLDAVVMTQLVSAIHGQHILYHVARRTAEDLAAHGSSEAAQIAQDLQIGTFPATVAEAVEGAIGSTEMQPSNLDTALGIPPFGTIAALLVVPLLASGGVDVTAGVVLACQGVVITGSASKFVAQNLEEVTAAISLDEVGRIDPRRTPGDAGPWEGDRLFRRRDVHWEFAGALLDQRC